MADKNQLGQVLMNLATNARDAMPTGGKVTILTNRVFIKQERIQTLEDGYYALLQFSDTGVGMTEEVKRRIFDPFFTTKDVGKGTGLGLSVIYGIIRQHKGEIQVNSAMYKGTTFYIYLPLIKEEKS
jgi:signal transduction histidine kinase